MIQLKRCKGGVYNWMKYLQDENLLRRARIEIEYFFQFLPNSEHLFSDSNFPGSRSSYPGKRDVSRAHISRDFPGREIPALASNYQPNDNLDDFVQEVFPSLAI